MEAMRSAALLCSADIALGACSQIRDPVFPRPPRMLRVVLGQPSRPPQ